MKLYTYADGSVATLPTDKFPSVIYGDFPADLTFALEFDDDSNLSLIAATRSGWGNYKIISGILYLAEQPIVINPPTEQHLAEAEARIGYPALPDWVKSGTAEDAETKISADFSLPSVGSLENAKAFIDTNLADIPDTVTTVTQLRAATNIKLGMLRAILKAMVDLFVVVRNYYIVTAKLLIYVRNVLWEKFHQDPQ